MFLVEKSKIDRITGLAMPIIAGMLSQNVLNLVDTAMVGRLGAESLAAVGISSMVAFLYLSPVLGITSGVQAIAARKKGEGKLSEAACPLNTALIYSLIVSVFIIAAAYWLVDPLFKLICETDSVREIASDYFLIRVSAAFFAISNFAFRGYWNAVDKPKVYMNTLFVMHATNIFFNYCLIFGKFGFPRLEAQGAALATAGSIVIGTIIYFYNAFVQAREQGFLRNLPSFEKLIAITKISIPAGFELFITMSNMVVLYWLVGKIGTSELAAINILMNIFLVTLLPAIGFGITLATLSGQALGAGDKEIAMTWGTDVSKIAFCLFITLSLPCFLFPKLILQIFTHDSSVIEVAIVALRIMGLTLAFEMLGMIFFDGLKGLGDTKFLNILSFVVQWVIFLPLVYVFIFVLKWSLLQIWSLQIVLHLIQTVILFNYWYKGKWLEIKLD